MAAAQSWRCLFLGERGFTVPHVNETEALVRALLPGMFKLLSGACSSDNKKVKTEASISNLHLYHGRIMHRNVWKENRVPSVQSSSDHTYSQFRTTFFADVI